MSEFVVLMILGVVGELVMRRMWLIVGELIVVLVLIVVLKS